MVQAMEGDGSLGHLAESKISETAPFRRHPDKVGGEAGTDSALRDGGSEGDGDRVNRVVPFPDRTADYPCKEAVDLHELIQSCIPLVSDCAEYCGVTIEHRAGPKIPRLRADTHDLEQIVIELLSSAVAALEEGGRISVAVRVTRRDGFRITITSYAKRHHEASQGEPILAAHRFDTNRFKAASPGVPHEITRALAERHGGRMEFVRRSEEEASVTICFPPDHAAHRTASIVPFPADRCIHGVKARS